MYVPSCMTHFGYFWPLGWLYFRNPIVQARGGASVGAVVDAIAPTILKEHYNEHSLNIRFAPTAVKYLRLSAKV